MRTHYFAGFTLIELLITMGVIVLILGVSLPAFSQFQKEQDVIGAAQVLRDAVLEAQNYALAPRAEIEEGVDHYRLVLEPRRAQKNAGYRIEEESSGGVWTVVQSGVLPKSVDYHHMSDCRLVSSGLVYSISAQGRIVEPTVSGVTAELRVGLKHIGLADDRQQAVKVQLATGRIDIVRDVSYAEAPCN